MWRSNMTTYYDNTIADKAWHTWSDGHDIFLNPCKEPGHSGEDVAQATSDWFNAPHPPNIPTTFGPTRVSASGWCNYITNAADPNGDDISYQIQVDGNIFIDWTSWHRSTENLYWNIFLEHGIHQIKARAKDTAVQCAWSQALTVIVDGNPSTPILVGPESEYFGETCTYSATATDPDSGDRIQYVFYWGDGTSTTTNWEDSGVEVSASITYAQPGTYIVQVQALDNYGGYSWSDPLEVAIKQNDAETGDDAGNNYATATYINSSPQYRLGMLFLSNSLDLDDWYRFHAATGQEIQVRVVNSKVQLYESGINGYLIIGDCNEFNYTCDASGDWVIRIHAAPGGEGQIQYSFVLYVNSPPNPILSGPNSGYVYNAYDCTG